MCGITGFIEKTEKKIAESNLNLMVQEIKHRGPDSNGIWYDENNGIGLAHARLSILDLTSAGHQPMASYSERYIISFNGEIYNHLLLRENLKKSGINIIWRGHSDTETLLACIDTWGLEKTIKKCSGMFAIVIFDKKENSIYLIRDRMGEKPLYYGVQNGVFLFGSELKALKRHPAFQGEIDRNSLALQLKYNYIPTPYSIYKGIKKLTPGTILKVGVNSKYANIEAIGIPVDFWSLKEVAINGQSNIYTGNAIEAVNDLNKLLLQSVKEQMEADVPLGAFLSGGIDSSLIVSLMQSQSSSPVETFSIGFDEEGYNEAIYAKQIAQYLGTKHTELYVSALDAMSVIPKLSSLYDEPFSDSSQIPTYLVSAMTKSSVTVSLSGDAGDELFGGYNRYLWTRKIWDKVKFMPPSVRRFIAWGMKSVSPIVWNKILRQIVSMPLPGDKIHKLANLLPAQSAEDFYFYLISHWHDVDNIVIGSEYSADPVVNNSAKLDLGSIEQNMMYLDSMSYLPDDILTKVDRAAMGVSLETRIPFLNHHVVEFAYQLPLSMKIQNGESKWILKQVLDKYIPREMMERPKMGFGVPIDTWLRGPLRDWAESLLDESRLKQEGFFHAEPIRKKWNEHLSGSHNWQHHLWDVLMFQAWLDEQ
jgi:asparagine synthase (glutamine-hydrolysing)